MFNLPSGYGRIKPISGGGGGSALPNPSLYWKFDDNTTDTMGYLNYRDDSGYPVLYDTAKFGKGINMSQSYMNENANLAMLPTNNSGWSISLWTNQNLSNSSQVQVYDNSGGGNYIMLYIDGGQMYIDGGNDGMVGTSIGYSGDTTFHTVMTVSGNTIKLYKDSVLESTGTITSRAGNAVEGFSFAPGYAGNWVDDFAIWKSVLTQTHVDYLWNSGTGRIAYPS